MKRSLLLVTAALLCSATLPAADQLRATGDLGVVVERADGSLLLIETSNNRSLERIEGLGDLSHATAVFSRDQRYAYLFGRDGGLTRIDLLTAQITHRVMQAGNSIGGAISQDGRLVAVSNYEPGGVRIFDAESLELVADLPADYGAATPSKVVGLVDAPGNRLVFSLWDGGEIWIADLSGDPKKPKITKFKGIGKNPYDALITPDGRYYIAGLFGEDGLALLDLWQPQLGVRRILPDYGRGEQALPVYKMPHLEGWAIAGEYAFIPAVGHHQVLVVNTRDWSEAGRIEVAGQPVFVIASPDGRRVWVNFAFPDNDQIAILDTLTQQQVATLKPGKGVLHIEFEPRGEEVWVSVRDEDQLQVYDTATLERRATLPALKPSGIFLTARAHRIGL